MSFNWVMLNRTCVVLGPVFYVWFFYFTQISCFEPWLFPSDSDSYCEVTCAADIWARQSKQHLKVSIVKTVQDFMQDQIIASYTCFGGHVVLTVKLVHKLSNVPDDLKWATNYKHTCDTIYTHFQGITNNIYGFGRPFCSFIVLPIHPYFYPSKWRVDRSLHKAMHVLV